MKRRLSSLRLTVEPTAKRLCRCQTAAGRAAAALLWALPGLVGAEEGNRLCGPKFLYEDPGTQELIVLCEKSDAIIRLDPQTGEIKSEAALGDRRAALSSPFTLCVDPLGQRLYVSCRRGQEVRELDAQSLQTLRRFPVRGDPTGVAVSADGRLLYVAVHSLDQVAVFELEGGTEIKRLAAGNGPEMVRLSPQQGRIYVTNLLPNPGPPDQPCRNEITVIDGASARVVERIILENANVGRWIAFTSDGTSAVVAISRPKNLIPMVQVARGWVVTNGFAFLQPTSGKAPVQLLIDLPNQSYADPFGVAITPDDKTFYLTCAGMDTVMAVDLARVREVGEQITAGLIPRSADHLGLSRRYVTSRIRVGANPESLVISSDGRWVYVGNRLDDTISVIDTATDDVVRTLRISLAPVGGESEITPLARRGAARVMRGERFFHSAAKTFQGQFSCASCHPDRGFDGLQYDLEPDGLGENILDNRNLRAVAGTGPFKWIGSNPDLTTQCGTRTAKWIMRTGWLSSVEVVALAGYIRQIEPVVNPYRSAGGKLTAAQQRGKDLFDRTATNDGESIPLHNRCDFCHSGPKFFDGRQADIGTKAVRDKTSKFDTAHLVNIFESAPYLHDGRAPTLEEIWTRHNSSDKHGVSSDWTKRQLNDLVEYLKTL